MSFQYLLLGGRVMLERLLEQTLNPPTTNETEVKKPVVLDIRLSYLPILIVDNIVLGEKSEEDSNNK